MAGGSRALPLRTLLVYAVRAALLTGALVLVTQPSAPDSTNPPTRCVGGFVYVDRYGWGGSHFTFSEPSWSHGGSMGCSDNSRSAWMERR